MKRAILLSLMLCSLSWATVTITTVKTGELDANGATVAFSFSFPYAATSEISVDVITDAGDVATRQTETTHYSVSPSSSTSGGTVTFVTAPANGNYVVVSRTTTLTQSADIDAGAYTSRTAIENAFDKVFRILQEHSDAIARSIRAPQGEVGTDMELTGALSRASSYLIFSGTGALTTATAFLPTSAVVSTYMETLLDDTTAVAARATLGLGPADAFTIGAITADGLVTKGPWFDVTHPDYGADPTGVADSTAAIQAAEAAADSFAGDLYFPPGTYKMSGNTTFDATGNLIFSNGAMLSIDTGIVATINCGIQAGNYQIFSGAGTVSLGTAIQSTGKWANVMWWGAKADSDYTVTENGAIFDAALTALGNGGTLYVPGHDSSRFYEFNTGITISTVTNIRMYSDGIARLRADAAADITVLNVQGTNWVSLENLHFVGADLTTNSNVIIDAVNIVDIRNCHSEHSSGHGWDISGGCDNVTMTGVRAESCIKNGFNLAGDNARVTLIGCHAIDNTLLGFDINTSTSEWGYSLVGCTAQANGLHGFNIVGDNVHLVGCRAHNNSATADNTSDGFVVTGSDCSVVGCTAVETAANGQRRGFTLGADVAYAGLNGSGNETAFCVATLPAFGAADTSPSVMGGTTFTTDGTGQTLIDFDDGYAGQIITVISTDATVFDTTATNLTGSSVDITTADGDVSTWICEDGTTWILKDWVDVSADNS